MKNFIAGIAVLLLIIIFPLQSALDTYNQHRINRFNDIVYRAAQTARYEGTFTVSNIKELKTNIIKEFADITEDEIVVNVTQTMKYRTNSFDNREVIDYDIKVPIKKLIFANTLLGIEDADNNMMYPNTGAVLSEVLSP